MTLIICMYVWKPDKIKKRSWNKLFFWYVVTTSKQHVSHSPNNSTVIDKYTVARIVSLQNIICRSNTTILTSTVLL